MNHDEPIPPKRAPTGSKGQHPLTLLIIPTVEERENIDWVMEKYQDLDDIDLHILIADDDSIDKTWSRAGTWAADDERMHLLRRPGRNKGPGFALRESYKWAAESEHDYEFVLQASANRSDDFGHIPAMIAALADGADLVIGERSVSLGGDDSSPRRAQGFAKFASASPVGDVESGFRGWRMSALRAIARKLTAGDYKLKAESVASAVKAGLKVVGVPVPAQAKTDDGKTLNKGGNSGAGTLLGLWFRRLTGRV
ncbi:MAG: dolichol-phosphate mannosyltransferase [Pseudohongiellaceae bacterium]|jgi:dolichol-phosphate mannosyltransferase